MAHGPHRDLGLGQPRREERALERVYLRCIQGDERRPSRAEPAEPLVTAAHERIEWAVEDVGLVPEHQLL